ncbi:MAG: DUF5056 domain-containing protein [Bacteroidales bacterium]|jgi:uncharacterized Tic20 family protein|nr:DUF5056 domain-containing protein [Bacteroidales bacterium]
MKDIDDNKLLNDFFNTYRDDIPDNDFTKNVMNKVPSHYHFINLKDIIITLILLIGTFFSIPDISRILSINYFFNPYFILFIVFCIVGIILTIISAIDTESDFL